jgi:hypothetical protein
MDETCRCRKFALALAMGGVLACWSATRLWAQDGYSIEPPAAAPAIAPDQKLGQAPQDYTHEFLRQEAVLLKQGQWQVDVGFDYLVMDHSFTQLAISGTTIPVDSELRRRLMLVPVDLRYGLTDCMQLFANVPFGWANTEESYVLSPTVNSDTFQNQGGIGDTDFGFSYLVHKSCGQSCDPDIIATMDVTAPTGKGSFFDALFLSPQLTLGQGLWAASWNVLFIHTYDPVIFFYGFGTRHPFAREFDGYDVVPGAQYNYKAGVGFAANERVTFSAMLYGSYIAEPLVDGQRVKGDALEPIYLRFAVTIAKCNNCIFEPFVNIGLTSDAANTIFGVTFTY